jgi:transcriptional regulator with PAS, ATPase and Fis domain
MHIGQQATQPAILLENNAGQVCFSTGVASDKRVQSQLLGQAAGEARALQTIVLNGKRMVVLRCPCTDATLYLVHHNEDCDALLEFVGSVDFAYPLLNHMLSDRFEAITVVGTDACVRYISPTHEAFFGLDRGEAVGMPVQSVIENTRLHHVVQTGQAEIGQVQEMRGASRVVARTPILQNGKVIGAMGRVMFKGPEQVMALSQEIAQLRSELAVTRRKLSVTVAQNRPLDMIVGTSEVIRQLKSDLLRVAPLEVPVLLVGESGTGKELAAHAVHTLSPRVNQTMVLVNAAAMPATLVESEMFGYDPGAFTGAERKGRRGKFELADRSSLFLDEIGDMPVEVQAKLLRVLQDKRFERVGGEQQRSSDFRLISATNRDLPELTRTGRFRLDLFYRISTVVLRMPPLRERLVDIRPIVDDFLRAQGRMRTVRDDVYGFLADQSWPGNVRQLLHEVEKATIFAESDELCRSDFRIDSVEAKRDDPPGPLGRTPRIHDNTQRVALSMVLEAMDRFGGNKRRVAQELGISRSYLYRLLETLPPATESAGQS